MKSKVPSIAGIDLFCGMGGATKGMMQAGLEVVYSCDKDAQAVAAHRWWHPDILCDRRDVRSVTPDELTGMVVWASPSCKPYSAANRTRTRGTNHPEHYPLSMLVEQCQNSKALIIENVAGLIWSHEGREEMGHLETACRRLCLSHSVHLLASNHYGVAQYRRRVFIVVGPLVVFPQGVPIPAEAAVMASEHREYWEGSPRQLLGVRRRATRRGRPLQECAMLQGVPVPQGTSKTAAHRLVGNCVPPAMAELVCQQVMAGLGQAIYPSALERWAAPPSQPTHTPSKGAIPCTP